MTNDYTDFVNSIIQHQVDSSHYINTIYDKKYIALHHTASGSDPFGVIKYWKDNANHIGTPFLIAGKPRIGVTTYKDGDIVQYCPSNRGIWHLGLTQTDLNRGGPNHKTSLELNMNAVGIELTCYGGLVKKVKGWTTYDGTTISDDNIIEYPDGYRGFKAYEKYTDAQVENLKTLMQYLSQKYDISIKYPGDQIFDICPDALCGKLSVFSHVSVRPASEKQDCHPQPNLIEMLKSL